MDNIVLVFIIIIYGVAIVIFMINNSKLRKDLINSYKENNKLRKRLIELIDKNVSKNNEIIKRKKREEHLVVYSN